MDIQVMDTASYTSFVLVKHNNDALAFRTTGGYAMTVAPFRQFTRLMTGQSNNEARVSDPVLDAFYNQALAATSIDQVKQLLMDANKYAAQQHFLISLLPPNQYAFCQPWLKGYNAQNGSGGGSAGTGGFYYYFYEARFWIDQNLKKSMGY